MLEDNQVIRKLEVLLGSKVTALSLMYLRQFNEANPQQIANHFSISQSMAQKALMRQKQAGVVRFRSHERSRKFFLNKDSVFFKGLTSLLDSALSELTSDAKRYFTRSHYGKDETLKKMIAVIESEFHPKRIILFGSRAAGTERKDSDYDICCVFEKPALTGSLTATAGKVAGRLIRRGFFEAVDVVATTEDELATDRQVFNEIRSKGITIYECSRK
ncbi:nucleotidyltransferase domain-containing protein [Bdellovibrionota bacterium FG-1]